MLAGVLASAEGWRPLYLGPNLPPDEIAAAARRSDAAAVAISMIYLNGEDARVQAKALRAALPEGVVLVIGGPAAAALTPPAEGAAAIHLPDLSGFRIALRTLRIGRGGAHVAGSRGDPR
jgi:methylmalonyl-CoA mutase cobalamin-binding subunit